MQYKISLVLPIYNQERYLNDTLSSLLQQTYTDFEIICVDDKSTDDSVRIIRSFMEAAPNLVLIQNPENMGTFKTRANGVLQLWEVELLFLVYYVSNYILKYFATSNADDKFQQIISSWRLFMNYSLTQEGQKYDFDRIRPQSTIQSRYLIFQKGKIEITTCNKRTAMTKINAVEDVQGRSTNSLNKLRQF
ncbi:Glycosyl_transferase family 2 protein [Hexamita inflata]|uniref:Glycosyl transferase family 2 protein n=1 Tax=Hexamita inflata TaxID=28002 RepID=A0AA86UB23_9EUKA|nr:Glycosyl transferase family 2 protein [Hexamita inflata]